LLAKCAAIWLFDIAFPISAPFEISEEIVIG
jgi:hypothetical protein